MIIRLNDEQAKKLLETAKLKRSDRLAPLSMVSTDYDTERKMGVATYRVRDNTGGYLYGTAVFNVANDGSIVITRQMDSLQPRTAAVDHQNELIRIKQMPIPTPLPARTMRAMAFGRILEKRTTTRTGG